MMYLWITKFFLVLVLTALADVFWTKYVYAAAKLHPFRAGFWSSMIVVCGVTSVVFYIEDQRFSIAAIFGAFIGTYWAVLKERQKTS